MDFWIVAQLGVDLLLFGMIALLLIRDGRPEPDAEGEEEDVVTPPPVDQAALEGLLDDMARMVNRAEKVAARLEAAGKEAARAQQALESPPPSPPKPPPPPALQKKSAPQPKPEYDESVYQAAVRLIKKGLSDDAVGAKVGLPSHEVGLIRRMGV